MALPRAVAEVEGNVNGVGRDGYPVDHASRVTASCAGVDSPVIGIEAPALPALYIRKNYALLVESHFVQGALQVLYGRLEENREIRLLDAEDLGFGRTGDYLREISLSAGKCLEVLRC